MRCKTLIGSLVLFALAGGARAGDPQPIKVPFDLLKTQHIVVTVKINGKGPYRLIFDTGAPMNLLSTKVAKESGVLADAAKMAVPGLLGVQSARMGTLEVGDVKAENLTTMIMDHPVVAAIDKALGPVQGIVGLPFFGKYRLTIDYQTREMTFLPGTFKTPEVAGGLMAAMSAPPVKKVLTPAGQWGFRVVKDTKDMAAGVTVKEVYPGSAAAAAGLKAGDRLLTLDGRWTDSVPDCYLAASFVPPGASARLTVLRGGKEMELTVKVQPGL